MLGQLKSEGFSDYRFARIVWFRDEQFRGKDIPDLDLPAAWRDQTAWVLDLVNDRALARDVQNVLYVFAHGGAQMMYAVMDDSDMMAALKDPHSCIGSDTRVWTSEMTTSHPRSIGNFPKIIGEFVREGRLSLEAALRKMTLEPATIFGLSNRGRLRVGMPADLVVFDPDTVSGPADYGHLEEPRGIDYVLVNGRVMLKFGRVQEGFPGEVIRKRHESTLDIAPEPLAPAESPDAKTDSPSAKNREAISEGKKRVKAVHPARKAQKTRHPLG
jgi:N-acyl-D-aspartate/D-glutamate deacylase